MNSTRWTGAAAGKSGMATDRVGSAYPVHQGNQAAMAVVALPLNSAHGALGSDYCP
jgi:hypothetical protein